MLFKRRRNLSLLFQARAALWPETGWRRRVRYYRHRIVREAGSAYGVAAGMACGICVSFTPFLGTHLLLTWGYCRLVRGNVLAGMIGTLVGNPVTFPFLFYLSYRVGEALMLPFQGEAEKAAMDKSIMLDQLHDVFVPTALGGTVLAFGLFPFLFLACYPLGRAAKALNHKRKQIRRKRAKEKALKP